MTTENETLTADQIKAGSIEADTIFTSLQDNGPSYVELAAGVVSAYVSNNSVPVSELGKLIETVANGLKSVDEDEAPAVEEAPTAALSPAQVKKSITPDALISFEDGKAYKTLRRHLTTRGLTPEQYRTKWGLPADYPMTSPAYSKQRSELARSLGLGQRNKAA